MSIDQHLQIQLVTSFEDLVDLKSEWLALEASVRAELPFQTWEWAVAWWQHLREDSRGVRDQLRICVVRDGTNTVVAIAPLILTERPSVGPVRLRYVQFIGADPNITEIRGMLCRRELANECCRLLRAHFAAHADEWDWISWDSLCPSLSEATDHPTLIAGEDRSTFVLPLASDWQAMKGRLGRNIKESLRKCYNSLRRDGLSYSLETLRDPRAIEVAMGEFFRLHSERASQKNTAPHSDVFASMEARRFLTAVCRMLAERGIARLFRLRVDGRVVASRVAFQMGSQLYLYYSGWDSAYARYSVMTTLLAEIIKDAIVRGSTAVNLSTGNDVSKTRWRPREVVYRSGIEVAPRFSARANYLGFRAARSVGTGKLARELLPSFLVRRSEPRGAWRSRPHPAAVATRSCRRVAGPPVVVAIEALDHQV